MAKNKAQKIYVVGIKSKQSYEYVPFNLRFYKDRASCADGVARDRKIAEQGDKPARFKVMKFVHAGDGAT